MATKKVFAALRNIGARAATLAQDVGNELSHAVHPAELNPGDHVYVWRVKFGFPFQHHGIYVGDDSVVHFDKSPAKPVACVARVSLAEFCKGACVRVVRYEQPRWKHALKVSGSSHTFASDPPDVVVQRALSFIGYGEGEYHLLRRNCEHLSVYCKTGRIFSQQVAGGGLVWDVARISVLVIGGAVIIGSKRGSLLGILPRAAFSGLVPAAPVSSTIVESVFNAASAAVSSPAIAAVTLLIDTLSKTVFSESSGPLFALPAAVVSMATGEERTEVLDNAALRSSLVPPPVPPHILCAPEAADAANAAAAAADELLIKAEPMDCDGDGDGDDDISVAARMGDVPAALAAAAAAAAAAIHAPLVPPRIAFATLGPLIPPPLLYAGAASPTESDAVGAASAPIKHEWCSDE